MLKKAAALFMVVLLFLGSYSPASAAGRSIEVIDYGTQIDVQVDGQPVCFTDVKPYIENDRTMVPLRFIAEALGASVSWEDPQVTITAGNKTVVLTMGSNLGKVNGNTVNLDIPAETRSGRVVVPLRFVADTFGAQVVFTPMGTSSSISSAALGAMIKHPAMKYGYSTSSTRNVLYGKNIWVYINGKRVCSQYSNNAVVDDKTGVAYMPFEVLAREIGAKTSYDIPGNTYTFEYNDVTIIIPLQDSGTANVSVNGKSCTWQGPVYNILIDRGLYSPAVPIADICNALGAVVDIDSQMGFYRLEFPDLPAYTPTPFDFGHVGIPANAPEEFKTIEPILEHEASVSQSSQSEDINTIYSLHVYSNYTLSWSRSSAPFTLEITTVDAEWTGDIKRILQVFYPTQYEKAYQLLMATRQEEFVSNVILDGRTFSTSATMNSGICIIGKL